MSQDLASYVPTDGLIAYYPFNGNADDESGNGNDGVNTGAVLASDRHENQDSAYYFSGSNCSTRIDVEVDTSSIETNQSFSVSLWYKHNGGGCKGPRLMEFWPGSDSYGKFTVNTNKNLDTGSFSPNIDYRSSVGRMGVRWDLKPEEEWTHLVYTIDQSSYKIYQNGELLTGDFYNEFGGQTSGTIKLAQNGAFGRMNHSAWDAIDGYLDDIGIWNRVLDENEIQNLYTSSTGDIILNGVVSAENNQIKNVADPTQSQDAVTLGLLLEKISNLQDQIDVLQSTSGSGTVTDQDGNSYPYLTYGDQVWTVKNAEMVTYRDGTPIPQVTDATEWANLTTGAWSYYDNDPSKGKLYNWYAVAGIHDNDENTPNKKLAPEGWHVPTDAEWTELENYLIANGYNYDGTTTGNKIAKAMSSTTGWNDSTSDGAPGNNQLNNNSSGFNAVPIGNLNYTPSFSNEGLTAVFWTSTQDDPNSDSAINRDLNYNGTGSNINVNGIKAGYSVRFVRD